MKKILLAIVLTLMTLSAYAEDTLSGAALSMRSSIVSYLRSEGYMPEIDSDGDIKFKKEGRAYYISLDNYSGMVYVDTFYMMDIEDSSMLKVRIAADKAQSSYKFIRCDVSEKVLYFKVSLPIKTIGDYKGMFDNILSVISLAKDKCIEEYNN